MATISARVPDDLEAALEEYVETENLDRSTAVRKLLTEGLEDWRCQQALERLEEGNISFSKAADIAGMSVWDFARLVEDEDVTWVGDRHLEDDIDAV